MAEAKRRWAIDTSVVLWALKDGDGDCRNLLQALDDTASVVATASVLLVAECVAIKDPSGHQQLELLLASSSFLWVPATRALALEARSLALPYLGSGLRGSDALHLASAVAVGAEAFYAADKHFNPLYGQTIGSTLVLRPGEFPGQQPMVTPRAIR